MPNAEASKILFFQQIVSESVRMFSLNRYQQSRCRCDDERLLEMCFDNFKNIKRTWYLLHQPISLIREIDPAVLTHPEEKYLWNFRQISWILWGCICLYSYGHITYNLFSTFKPQLNRRLSVFEKLIEILEPISKIDFKWLLLGNWTVIQTDK